MSLLNVQTHFSPGLQILVLSPSSQNVRFYLRRIFQRKNFRFYSFVQNPDRAETGKIAASFDTFRYFFRFTWYTLDWFLSSGSQPAALDLRENYKIEKLSIFLLCRNIDAQITPKRR